MGAESGAVAGGAGPLQRALELWRRQSLAGRAVAVVVVTVVALNAAAALVSGIGGRQPSGPRSSSYATSPAGLAAAAELLRRFDHPVRAALDSISSADLSSDETIVVSEPDALLPDEARRLAALTRDGARVVVAGASTPSLRFLVEEPPVGVPYGPASYRPVGSGAGIEGLRRIETAGEGSWREHGRAQALLSSRSSALLLAAGVGAGHVLLLADPSPIQNRLLDRGDNAALALALAGEVGRPVVFVESVHGYGVDRGLGALPTRWKLALIAAAVAALALIAARARRIGAAEVGARPPHPPRREYLDSLGALSARSGRIAELSDYLREIVRARLDDTETPPPPDDGEQELLRLGAALAELEARRPGSRRR